MGRSVPAEPALPTLLREYERRFTGYTPVVIANDAVSVLGCCDVKLIAAKLYIVRSPKLRESFPLPCLQSPAC